MSAISILSTAGTLETIARTKPSRAPAGNEARPAAAESCPAAAESCPEDCHYCSGPETD